MLQLLRRGEGSPPRRTTGPRLGTTHQPIIDDRRESMELDIMIILNLALPERTCYEPLASTHPDTQGIASLTPHALWRLIRRDEIRSGCDAAIRSAA